MTDKKIKVEFAPGCFDGFEGTQEELDHLVAEITRLAESGELADLSMPVDIESLSEEEAVALAAVMEMLNEDSDEEPPERRVH